MEEWIEENLDFGKVVDVSLNGTSGWSSQYKVKTSEGAKLFMKTCRSSDDTMFKGEALGLQALYSKLMLRFHVVSVADLSSN